MCFVQGVGDAWRIESLCGLKAWRWTAVMGLRSKVSRVFEPAIASGSGDGFVHVVKDKSQTTWICLQLP